MAASLSLLPIALSATTVSAFFLSYVIAVTVRDLFPYWPYISYTGAQVPESCVFGQLLNLSAFLALATIYVRYKLVQAFNTHVLSLVILNKVSLAIGALSSLGVSLVANFQEFPDRIVYIVHVTGTLMTFVFGVGYSFCQSVITRKMYPMYNGHSIFVIRLLISFAALIALVTSSTFEVIAQVEAGPFRNITDYPFNWIPSEPGYNLHLASNVSDWAIVIAFLSFFLTYVSDFRKIAMRILPELLVTHLDERPIMFDSNRPPTERTGLLAA